MMSNSIVDKRILVTGASGFVGRHLVRTLAEKGAKVIAVSRSPVSFENTNVSVKLVSDYADLDALRGCFFACDVVIHLAARAHVLREIGDPRRAFFEANVVLTKQLAELSVQCGVSKFLMFSSIGVHGSVTRANVINEQSPLIPDKLYAESKLQAELVLSKVLAPSDCDYLIVRPTLIYGADAPGNFARLLTLAKLPLPLPLGAINNRRSMLSIDNLTDFICQILPIVKWGNQAVVLSDDNTVSVRGIISSLREGMSRKPSLISVSPSLLLALSRVVGKRELVAQLCSDLVVDNTLAKTEFDWRPAKTTTEVLISIGNQIVDDQSEEL